MGNTVKLNEHSTGLVVGGFLGLWHLGWSILVALGWAQVLLDFVYSIHFLNNPFTITGFDFTKAATLVVVTTAVGYGGGYTFTFIWNKVHKG